MEYRNSEFRVDFLDHVAIRVKDLAGSAKWYEKVLGLKMYRRPEWGAFPILMLSGKSGVALFPANVRDKALDSKSKNVKIDHFAFNVSNDNFNRAKVRFTDLKLEFSVQDHHFFHSIYTEDPDGHIVELTTLVVDENLFY